MVPKWSELLGGPILETLDSDKDAKLSREEWVAGAKRIFAACRANSTGRVDRKTLMDGLNTMFAPQATEGSGAGLNFGQFLSFPILARADADKDGRLTSDEFAKAARSTFDEADPKDRQARPARLQCAPRSAPFRHGPTG